MEKAVGRGLLPAAGLPLPGPVHRVLTALAEPKGFLEQFLAGSMGETQLRALAPQLIDAMKSAETLQKLFAEPSVMVMPYRVRFE